MSVKTVIAKCYCTAVREAHVSFEEKAPWFSTTDHLPKHIGKS